jgi:hypothetical protein
VTKKLPVLLKRFRAAFIVNVNTSETTGWLEQYDDLTCSALHRKNGLPVQTLVWASIYSLKSMNILK